MYIMQNSRLPTQSKGQKDLPLQTLFGQFFLPLAHTKNSKVSFDKLRMTTIIKGLPPLNPEHQF